MTEVGAVRDWMFKGITVQIALDRFEKDGVAVRAAHEQGALQRLVSLEDFSATIRQAAMKALPVYLSFFCLENAVRELIAERLSENHGADWWATCVPSKIRQKVSDREKKEGENRWHSRRGQAEIYYTDFGDLKQIILANWDDFQDLFPDQNWIAARLAELEQSRNIIAHNNELDPREVDRIKLYVDDWIRQVG